MLIGIRRNQSVTPGVIATLFIDLPGMEEPLHYPEQSFLD